MLNFKHPTHSHALPRHSNCRHLLHLDYYYSLLDILSFLQLPVCGQKEFRETESPYYRSYLFAAFRNRICSVCHSNNCFVNHI